MSILLAVDLGATVTGWAIFRDGLLSSVGVWRVKRSQGEHPGERYSRLRRRLLDLKRVSSIRPDHVAYEKVQMHASSTVRCSKCGVIRNTTGRGKSLRCGKCGGPAFRQRMMNTLAAHAYGATEAYLHEYCFDLLIEPMEVHTSAVKKAATGKGAGKGTKKSDILAAARERWPDHKFKTDDAADAAFIGLHAVRELGLEPEEIPPLFR